MRKRNVMLRWQAPIPAENLWDEQYGKLLQEKGIYSITRKHGSKEKIIYIGKTYDCFANRLLCHDQQWLEYVRGLCNIRLAILEKPKQYDDAFLEDVESALIYEWQPEENTMKKNGYTFRSDYFANISHTGYMDKIIPENDIDAKMHWDGVF